MDRLTRLAIHHASQKTHSDLEMLASRMDARIAELELLIKKQDAMLARTRCPNPDRELAHEIALHVGIDIDEYTPCVHTWNGRRLMTFRSTVRANSIYTLNLDSMLPTVRSPIQKRLSDGLISKLRTVY